MLEYYGNAPAIPPQIVVPVEVGETQALEEFLSELRGSRVEVRPARRGEKKRLQELAAQNADLALQQDVAETERKRSRRVEALEELRESLNLESLPLRIECFDISNIQETAPVGSMVVFQDALPKKAHYRKFGIRNADGQDDFAMMAEVISRRFARARSVTADEYDEGFAAIPNLVVIDGGKGQLSAALAAMQAFDLPRVAVISLAKRDEEIFLPDRPEPIVLDPSSAGLQLLQRIRDEAHRFALGFHRQRRDSRHARIDPRCARRGSVRRASGRSSSTSARRSACSARPRRSSRASPGSRRRRAGRSTRRCTEPAAPRAGTTARLFLPGPFRTTRQCAPGGPPEVSPLSRS